MNTHCKAVVFGLAAFSAMAHAGEVLTRQAGSAWQDGLLVGDGATAALAYAPAHFEWMINRNDIFDSRVFDCDYVPHAEVMACVATNEGRSVAFLEQRERHGGLGHGNGSGGYAGVMTSMYGEFLGLDSLEVHRGLGTCDGRRGLYGHAEEDRGTRGDAAQVASCVVGERRGGAVHNAVGVVVGAASHRSNE